MLCEYGCEKEAIYQFKNGKWCCSINVAKCDSIKIFGKSPFNKGKKDSKETREKKRIANIKKRKWNKGLTKENDIRVKKQSDKIRGISLSDEHKKKLLGRIPWNKNKKNCLTKQSIEKISINNIGKHKNSEKFKEDMRQKMLNGQSLKMIKCIKKISKEEIKLRNLVRELYPNCEFQYSVFRYSLDVAILEYKIAIEFDGWYHFDSKENKEYHKMRQEKIEKEGWKFLRYTIFDKFPNLEKIKKDIELLKNETTD